MPSYSKKPNSPTLNLDHLNAATLLVGDISQLRLVLIGCGGTGSWLAPAVARLASVQREQGKEVVIEFWDHDTVEAKNIPRQNFCAAELGLNKAVTLGARYGQAWGLEIGAQPRRFDGKLSSFNGVTIVLGCVDNATARRHIANALKLHWCPPRSRTWWLDCGNEESSGQVLLGNTADKSYLAKAFTGPKVCQYLPLPTEQEPSLLKAAAKKTKAQSCAEMQLENTQSLAVNQMVASIATDYLLRMLTGGLKRQATYFDLVSGSMRSTWILKGKA